MNEIIIEDKKVNLKIKQFLLVVLGSIIMGFGIYLTILSNLGSDPMTAFWIGISSKLSITVGQANILTNSIILVVVFFLNKKEVFIGSLINPIVVSLTTDFLLMSNFKIDNIYIQIILCIIGLAILAIGIAIYSLANFGKGAYEALVFAINQRTNYSIRFVRTSSDIIFLIAALILGAKISLGIILAIVLMGIGIQYSINFFKKYIKFS